ncbi:hypothetical protein AVEN_135471-1 [Araneus ventricosus]|uniref:Uncharacterized protein n=1 Tax=Araneus ventricosus TaxID=182803 RepID=A0A4Y2BCX1_ARAVE|nr:hypothetical protein AVEN_135471-1 [Araneus ventricosus]
MTAGVFLAFVHQMACMHNSAPFRRKTMPHKNTIIAAFGVVFALGPRLIMHTGRLELQLSSLLFINPINIPELSAQDKNRHEEQPAGCGSQGNGSAAFLVFWGGRG